MSQFKQKYLNVVLATISAIGPQGEGRAFYVNGMLTPDIYLVRGQKYTFMIETGVGNKENADADTFHPVYITDDPSGGHQLKPELQAKLEKIYAGTSVGKFWAAL